MAAEPLVMTLEIDPESQERFERLRRLHFPPGKNLVPAHISLFHQLPGAELDFINHETESVCRELGRFSIRVTGFRDLGRGVAYRLESEPLSKLRARLAQAFSPWLSAQDRQPFRPHITIQNKVQREDARTLHAQLAAAFAPFAVQGTGVLIWKYLSGPWVLARRVPFAPGSE